MPVGSDPGDRFVVMGTRILVITNAGQVWGHDVNDTTIGDPFRLDGPPVAYNPDDRSVLTMGNRILVITKEGSVWGHGVKGTTIGDAFRLDAETRVPAPPREGDLAGWGLISLGICKFVLTFGHWIFAITRQGRIWAYPALTKIPEVLDTLDGPPVAANPGDRFVVTMGTRLLVTTNEGQVWGHDVNGFPPTIGDPFRLDGPPVAYNPDDRSVLTMGTRLLVITNEGQVWGHDVNDTTIGDAFRLVI